MVDIIQMVQLPQVNMKIVFINFETITNEFISNIAMGNFLIIHRWPIDSSNETIRLV